MKRKKVVYLIVSVGILIGGVLLAPSMYRHHVTAELSNQLDEKYGQDGWVAAWVLSDRQIGEQINLYRTLYLKFLYPKYLGLTPYKSLRFTHPTGYATVPPHYAVLVYCSDGEFAYRWSMKKDLWYISYHNSIEILPVWEKEKILGKWINIERIDGLNLPKEEGKNLTKALQRTPTSGVAELDR